MEKGNVKGHRRVFVGDEKVQSGTVSSAPFPDARGYDPFEMEHEPEPSIMPMLPTIPGRIPGRITPEEFDQHLEKALGQGDGGLSKPTPKKAKQASDGGATGYYELPEGARELNDLIEHKKMSFAVANIFKACYRLGDKEGIDVEYDLKKMEFYINRIRGMIKNGTFY